MENAKNILNEILLKMKYDSSKTLSENKNLVEQQQFNPYAYKLGTAEQSSRWYWNFIGAEFQSLNRGPNSVGGERATFSNLPSWKVTYPNSIVYYLVTRNGHQRYFQYTLDGKTETQKGSWDIVNNKLEVVPDEQYQKSQTTAFSDMFSGGSTGSTTSPQQGIKKSSQTTKRKYKRLNDNFVVYSYNKEHIGKLQDCLGMKIKESEKGFFGPKTLAALKNTSNFSAKVSKNEPITVAEITAFCSRNELQTLKSQGIKELPTQEPAKAQPTKIQQNTQQPQQELTGAARRKANRVAKKTSQPEG